MSYSAPQAEAEALARKIEKNTAQIHADEKILKGYKEQIKVKHGEHAKKTTKLESIKSVIKDDLFDCANAGAFTDINGKFNMNTPHDVDVNVTDKEFGYKILSAIDSSGVDMHIEDESKTDLHAAKNWTKEQMCTDIKRVFKITHKRKYQGGVLEDSSDENDSPEAKKSKMIGDDASSASTGAAHAAGTGA